MSTPLTDRQTAWLRSELGQEVTGEDLQARYDRLGSVRDVAIEVIRSRRNALLEQPASVSLQGVASASYGDNIREYGKILAGLTKLDDDPSDNPGSETGAEDTIRDGEVLQLTRSRRR
jgi:hypothetical protein